MMCDGSLVSRTGDTAALFAAIGTAYGAGDGSTTFALPNLKGKVPVGRDAAQTEFDTLGEAVGSKTHSLTTSELAAHTHSDGTLAAASAGSHSHGGSAQNDNATHSHPFPGGRFGTTYSGTFSSAGHGAPFSGDQIPHAFDWQPMAGTEAVIVPHTHGITADGAHGHDVTGATANAGGGGAHNNIQPSVVVNYMVKL